MSADVPDDWGSYYLSCPDCGARWHASEGYCSCIDDAEQADSDEATDEATYEANYDADYADEADEAEQAEDGGGE